jgi:hypothetical protein
MNKESLIKDKVDFEAIGEKISHELAAKMVKDHHDKYTLDESHSYIIGKTAIDMILAQPGCVGIRFFDALNEEGNKTLVYVGIDSKGKSIIEITTVNGDGKLAIIKGSSGDHLLVPKPVDWFS